jgi:hypothetical protein
MLNHAPTECDTNFHNHCIRMKLYFGHATKMWSLLDMFCDPNNNLVDGFLFFNEFKQIINDNVLFDSNEFINKTFNENHSDERKAPHQDTIQHGSKHHLKKKRAYDRL